MWFADIITDISWLNSVGGKLGVPRSRAKQRAGERDLGLEFLVYGDERQIRHLRVLIHTDDYEEGVSLYRRKYSVLDKLARSRLADCERLRRYASARTDFGTPWAENTTFATTGTSSSSSTKTAPWASSLLYHGAVVHDLVADIDGGAVAAQRLFHHPDGAVHTRAATAGAGEEDVQGRLLVHGEF
jgi:hypothetical protein